MDSPEVIERHQASGRPFSAAGVDSFVLEVGGGDPVVCLHGVPASAFRAKRTRPGGAEQVEQHPQGWRPQGPGRGATSARRRAARKALVATACADRRWEK